MSRFQELASELLHYWFKGEEIKENYRPTWLKGLEVDFFLPGRNLAIEVQGKQHYLFSPELQGTVESFKAQRRRDNIKVKLLSKNHINLVKIKILKPGIISRNLRLFCPGKVFSPIPKELKQKLIQYRHFVHKKMQNGWILFKVKKKKILPINKVSSKSEIYTNTLT